MDFILKQHTIRRTENPNLGFSARVAKHTIGRPEKNVSSGVIERFLKGSS